MKYYEVAEITLNLNICDACGYDTFFSHYPEDDFKKSQEKMNALINS